MTVAMEVVAKEDKRKAERAEHETKAQAEWLALSKRQQDQAAKETFSPFM